MTVTEEQIRDYARIVALAAAVNTGDEIEIAQVLDDELRVSLDDGDLTRVHDALAGAVIVVVFPDELDGTEDATEGPWEVVPLQVAKFAALDLATVVGGDPERVTVDEAIDGNAVFRSADARLIVALRNAYQAATEVTVTTEPAGDD